VTIGYDTPWRQVHALLLRAAELTPGLLKEPAPFILQTALNDFYVTYQLNVYTEKADEMPFTYSDMHKNIQDQFNEYGVQIMSPNYLADRSVPTVVPKERWYAPPAAPPEPGKSAP
jgi:small-conductance mechanosensitive channel